MFGWQPCEHGHEPETKPRFWRRQLGIAPSAQAPVVPHMHEKKRSIVLFVTDGENDPGDAE